MLQETSLTHVATSSRLNSSVVHFYSAPEVINGPTATTTTTTRVAAAACAAAGAIAPHFLYLASLLIFLPAIFTFSTNKRKKEKKIEKKRQHCFPCFLCVFGLHNLCSGAATLAARNVKKKNQKSSRANEKKSADYKNACNIFISSCSLHFYQLICLPLMGLVIVIKYL